MMETKFYVEPKEPVETKPEMINAMIEWANEEGREFEILSDDVFVNVKIDGKKYIAKLEPFKGFVMFKSGIQTSKSMFGYKCIYFYNYEE